MIHAYKLNGYNIILDQNSGCVHSVDPVAYDMITMYQDHDKEEIRRVILEKYKDQPDVTNADIDLCFEDIEALIADGRLFAEDTFEAVADQFKRRQGGTEGHLPACCSRLQPGVQILLCRQGRVRWPA